MADLFGRKYSLVIGNPKKVTQPQEITRAGETFKIDQVFPGTIPPEIQEQEFIEITDLQIRASLPQTKTASTKARDKAYIEIYNLSNETLEFIQRSKLILLKGGYKQDKELSYLFTGEILSVSSERNGQDIVTTLLCGQRVRVGKDVRVQKTYSAGVAYKDIIQDLLNIAKDNFLPVGNVQLPSGTGEFYPDSNKEISFTNRGLPIEGYLLDELDRVCAQIGYRAYMVLGKIMVEPLEAPRTREEYQVFPENLQAEPKVALKAQYDSASDDVQQEITLKMYLDGDITTDKRIRLREGRHKGLYTITNVEHVLDFEGKEWTTEVTAKIVS